MRILILTKYFPPEIGAPSHLFYELSESLVGRGHQVTVVTGFPTYNADKDKLDRKYKKGVLLSETMNGIKVERLRELPLPTKIPVLKGLDHFVVALIIFLRGLFIKKQDIILVYSPPLTIGLSAYLISQLKKIPFVVNIQDLFPQNAIDLGILNNRHLVRMFEQMERFVYRNADYITVHSRGNKQHVVNKGAEPEKVEVVPNWVDTEFIKPADRMNRFRREHGLGEEFVVSFAGTMGYSQNLDVVLESADRLKEYKDVLFLLVGDGVKKEHLERKAEELNLENVKFLPMQPRECYPEILHASDVSLATLRREVRTPVVPSKLLSIMSSGRSVLASMNLDGDAPRLIEDANCGICVEADNADELSQAILRLYRDQSLREKLGKNGRDYAEKNLSRKVCAKRYESLFAKAKGDY